MPKKPSQSSIKKQAAKLRNRPGWDPQQRGSDDIQSKLQSLDQELQNERTYEESASCEACQRAQDEAQDPSALCEHHLQQALGF
ncbi:MAG: hypothetical protein EP343_20375 [Deltaproteobacteria bacterium]|nr:MAG: hypothetical protein EP343_20375 [Deltaproteobacteria bacterium]